MKIISYAWTLPALEARVKTVTRRNWSDRYALSFKRDELVQAWDKLPRAGGQRVGTVRLTVKPYQEWTRDMPTADFWNEGLAYMQRLGYREAAEIWSRWHLDNRLLWVVRFQLLEVKHAA